MGSSSSVTSGQRLSRHNFVRGDRRPIDADHVKLALDCGDLDATDEPISFTSVDLNADLTSAADKRTTMVT